MSAAEQMTTAEMLELDEAVCVGLRKRPGESLREAALRIMQNPQGDRAWRVAREILSPRGRPWDRMRRAAKAARRSGLLGDAALAHWYRSLRGAGT